MTTHTLIWQDTLLHVHLERYNKPANTALLLTEPDGMPYAAASVNPDIKLAVDEVAIKDYNENAGLLDVLQAANIVSAQIRYVATGYVTVPVCRLLIKEE